MSLVCLDLDNTLYNWVNYFGRSFRAMVHALARELEMPEAELVAQFRVVYAKQKSLEFSFAIQHLEICRALSTPEVAELIRVGRGAFLRVRRSILKPYSGVVSTLAWLVAQDHTLVAISSSSIYNAQLRLYELGLDQYFHALAAWDGFERDSDDEASDGYVPAGRTRRRSRIAADRVWPIPTEHLKPDTWAFELALGHFHLDPSDAWSVGDSAEKDLAPASSLGLRTVLAAYGHEFDQTDYATVRDVVPWSAKEVQTHYESNFLPDYEIKAFDELQGILPVNRPTLF